MTNMTSIANRTKELTDPMNRTEPELTELTEITELTELTDLTELIKTDLFNMVLP
jgi:hypothetical protein